MAPRDEVPLIERKIFMVCKVTNSHQGKATPMLTGLTLAEANELALQKSKGTKWPGQYEVRRPKGES